MNREISPEGTGLEESSLYNELAKDDVAIFAKNLIKDYEIGEYIVRAVENVSIKIKIGELLVIKGDSGAGKTTLLNLIGALDSPNSGTIIVNGVNITDLEEESLATFRLANTGFIFQNYNLISTLTAEENVMFPMKMAGMTLEEQRERSIELLKLVGLGDRREHLPFQLSAGEQQRVAIARALANNPTIIIADEPTANLDQKTSLDIRDLFKKIQLEEKTIIIASHDINLIELADRLILFQDGKIVEEKQIEK